MARKLGLGSMMLLACIALAGCQTGSGSRLAGNNNKSPAVAKQGTQLPAPAFPTSNPPNNGIRTTSGPAANNFSSAGAFPTAPNNNGFPPPTNNGFPPPPNNSAPAGGAAFVPAGPSNLPSGSGGRITQPDVPTSNFSDPGISPIPPPPPMQQR